MADPMTSGVLKSGRTLSPPLARPPGADADRQSIRSLLGQQPIDSRRTGPVPTASPASARVTASTVASARGFEARPEYDPVAAIDFAIRHVGDGNTSPYGVEGTNSAVKGFWRGNVLGLVGLRGWGANKCNFFVHDVQKAGGVDALLPNNQIPSASDWHDQRTRIYAYSGGRIVGEYRIIARGDLSTTAFDLGRLRPGDVAANEKHVGVYAPVVYRNHGKALPGYSSAEIYDVGQRGSLAYGETRTEARTISAATRNGESPHPMLDQIGLLGGVKWAPWGFRPGEEPDMTVRRFVPIAQKAGQGSADGAARVTR